MGCGPSESSGGPGSGGTTGGGSGGTSSSSGGTTATGGTTSSGGTTASGGITGSGGETGSGGVSSSGGTVGTGGTIVVATGGSAAPGGAVGSGGSGAGGKGAHGGGAPATGGSAPGGSSGGGSSGSGCGSAQICDDFETGSINTSTWKVQQGNGFTATVGTDQAHSGTHSLHIVAPNTSNSAFITETKTFPAADFWGRAWMRFSGPNGGHQMYIYVNFPGDQLRLLNRLGSDSIQVNFQKSDQFYSSKTTVPQTTWFCYEWHVTTSATTIYKDGTQLTDIKAPGITGGTSLSLGFQRFATATAAADLWIDDVAVGPSQIGCN